MAPAALAVGGGSMGMGMSMGGGGSGNYGGGQSGGYEGGQDSGNYNGNQDQGGYGGGNSGGYGGGSTGGGDYGGMGGMGGMGGLGGMGGNGGNQMNGLGNGQVINAAVNTRQTVQTINVPSSNSGAPSPTVDINSGALPLTLRFNSQSSSIKAIQRHVGSRGNTQRSNAVDEPDVLIQTVKKPIVQEIREIIQPYRKRTQEVRPVQERVQTVIAKSTGIMNNNGGGNRGNNIGGGGGSSGGIGDGGDEHGGQNGGGYSGGSGGEIGASYAASNQDKAIVKREPNSTKAKGRHH